MRNNFFHLLHSVWQDIGRIEIIGLIQIVLNAAVIRHFEITGYIDLPQPHTASFFYLFIRVIGSAMED